MGHPKYHQEQKLDFWVFTEKSIFDYMNPSLVRSWYAVGPKLVLGCYQLRQVGAKFERSWMQNDGRGPHDIPYN